jgi:antitoxin MazE
MAQTALRKMGNSTGMIVPRSILGEIGLSVGATMDLSVEDGRLIATPMCAESRAGWEAAAADIAAHPDADESEWQSFGNEDDDALIW